MKSSTKKEIRAWVILLAFQLTWILPCVWDYNRREPVDEEVIESETELIKWKEDTEVSIEELKTEIVQKPEQSLGTFRVTAYCKCSKCCGKWAGGLTASGTVPTEGRTIAVDTEVIPFGTEVLIGGESYTAEDTGYLIKGYSIDIFMESHEEALEWGVQYLEVKVVE